MIGTHQVVITLQLGTLRRCLFIHQHFQHQGTLAPLLCLFPNLSTHLFPHLRLGILHHHHLVSLLVLVLITLLFLASLRVLIRVLFQINFLFPLLVHLRVLILFLVLILIVGWSSSSSRSWCSPRSSSWSRSSPCSCFFSGPPPCPLPGPPQGQLSVPPPGPSQGPPPCPLPGPPQGPLSGPLPGLPQGHLSGPLSVSPQSPYPVPCSIPPGPSSFMQSNYRPRIAAQQSSQNQQQFSESGHTFFHERQMFVAPNIKPKPEDEATIQRREDQKWIKQFLETKGRSIKNASQKCESPLPNQISIREMKKTLYSTAQLVSQLTTICENLKLNVDDPKEWNDSFAKALQMKQEIQSRLKMISDDEHLQRVKAKVSAIAKRRARRLRAKKRLRMEEQHREAQIAEKDAAIEKWRMKKIHEEEEKKKEEELKRAADAVLCEVRKKQADVKRMQDILKSLEKLRKLRKEAASRKGIFTDQQSDETFNKLLEELRSVAKKRTEVYGAEQRALMVMLEGEQEEERKRDLEGKRKRERDKQMQKKRRIDMMLFGDDTPPDPFMQPFRQYYTQAELSLPALVQIRREWDAFLVPPDHPEGSAVPQGWVLPDAPSDQTWASALQTSDAESDCEVREQTCLSLQSRIQGVKFVQLKGQPGSSRLSRRPFTSSPGCLPYGSLAATVIIAARLKAEPHVTYRENIGIEELNTMEGIPLKMPECASQEELVEDVHVTVPDYLTILRETEYDFSLEKWVLTGLQNGFMKRPASVSSSSSCTSGLQPSCPPYWMMFSSPQQTQPRQRSYSLNPSVLRAKFTISDSEDESESPVETISVPLPEKKDLNVEKPCTLSQRSQRKAQKAFVPDLLHPPTCLSSLPHQRRKNLRQCSLSVLETPSRMPSICRANPHRRPSTGESISPNSCTNPSVVSRPLGLPSAGRDSAVELLAALSPEERELLGVITSRGYPLRTAIMALQKTGRQAPEKILNYLVACDHLCQLGYDIMQVEEALEMFQNCETKAEEFLHLLSQFNEMGFQQNAIKEVLLVHENHRERALEELMMRVA
ncbi:hypothetical protein WMY93_013215 [Mugilogobius chulae]|uniref:Uncharacterized protein n=1 Tax=Mugilogobius chulae TaxID=88201 RepID=A0AAW0P5E7_9GOBI